ncbi:zinc-ribbon domain-containing protein [Cupriavidus basilensis]|uniref:zinc-ribbon domain-containing protein n=1 Tax=Cupriavidus basilensis TaxID=68895 RepID=UPI00320479E4
MKCSECHADVSDKAAACPKCGNKISGAGKHSGKALLWVAGGLAALFVIGAIVQGERPEAKEEHKLRLALELCRKEQNDDLKSISERRLVRGACDRIRDEYIQKYNRNPE